MSHTAKQIRERDNSSGFTSSWHSEPLSRAYPSEG